MATFKTYFDRTAFMEDIKIKRAHGAEVSEKDDPLAYYLREKGLRFVIRAADGVTLEKVGGLIRDLLHPETEVEELFEVIDEKRFPEDLKTYFLASVRGASERDIKENVFDISYYLQDKGQFVTVEPDRPYLNYIGPIQALSSSSKKACPIIDRAWALRQIRADAAWSFSSLGKKEDGRGVIIGHLDTGWTKHDDLDDKNIDFTNAKDYIVLGGNAQDPLGYIGWPGHGTKTGSVIMSDGGIEPYDPNRTTEYGTDTPGKITGVARRSKLVPIRCIKSVVAVFNADVARGVSYAWQNGCHIISMSLVSCQACKVV